tara:strand:- start:96 stop:287 length:192 start_codon:yes stop_codon:yes gene_type:complete
LFISAIDLDWFYLLSVLNYGDTFFLSLNKRMSALRPEVLRQVIFASAVRFANKGEPLRRSDFK